MSTRSPNRMPAPILALMVAVLLAFSIIPAARAQNVDWMTSDQAAALDLSFDVMVPVGIPTPFEGSPAIGGSGGYYSLYWVNYGGAPTYLQIEGLVGGSLPAGSPADLNKQLFVNASVQGYEAIHDVTSIYDNVWWIAGGVLYTVSSNNMTGTDSLSLANSLIALQQPVQQELVPLTPMPRPPAATTVPEPQVQAGTGGSNIADALPTQPPTESATDAADIVSVPDAVSDSALDESVGDVSRAAPSPDAISESVADDGDVSGPTSFLESDTSGLVNALSGSVALSDGTAGPTLPSGGDGTGGIRQIAIP